MAAAVILQVPARHALADYLLLPLVGTLYTAGQLDDLLARFTDVSETPVTQTLYRTGPGRWRVTAASRRDEWWTDWNFTTGVDDHLYLFDQTVLRAMAVQKTASATTAPATTDLNLATTLTDAMADFTQDVAVGDVVVLSGGTGLGASAMVLEVRADDDQLVTEPLPFGAQYTAGTPYLIGRPPGTDTAEQHPVVANRIRGHEAAIDLLQRLLNHESHQRATNVGGAGFNPVPDQIRQRLSELIGVGFSRACY